MNCVVGQQLRVREVCVVVMGAETSSSRSFVVVMGAETPCFEEFRCRDVGRNLVFRSFVVFVCRRKNSISLFTRSISGLMIVVVEQIF